MQKPGDQKIVRDERGQDQPATKERAQQAKVSPNSPDTGYRSSSQDDKGQPQNPPKEEQKGEQRKQPSQQY